MRIMPLGQAPTEAALQGARPRNLARSPPTQMETEWADTLRQCSADKTSPSPAPIRRRTHAWNFTNQAALVRGYGPWPFLTEPASQSGFPIEDTARSTTQGKKERNSGNNTDKEADTTRRKKHRRKPSWETCQQPRNLACEVNATHFLFPSLLFRKPLFSAHVSTNLSSGKSQIQRKKTITYAKQPET